MLTLMAMLSFSGRLVPGGQLFAGSCNTHSPSGMMSPLSAWDEVVRRLLRFGCCQQTG
jgi:hypothetical protein